MLIVKFHDYTMDYSKLLNTETTVLLSNQCSLLIRPLLNQIKKEGFCLCLFIKEITAF